MVEDHADLIELETTWSILDIANLNAVVDVTEAAKAKHMKRTKGK